MYRMLELLKETITHMPTFKEQFSLQLVFEMQASTKRFQSLQIKYQLSATAIVLMVGRCWIVNVPGFLAR